MYVQRPVDVAAPCCVTIQNCGHVPGWESERSCTRITCSYLADVPQAHAERVRKLLPALLSVQGGAGSGGFLAASCFLLPLLSQVNVTMSRQSPSAHDTPTDACGFKSSQLHPALVVYVTPGLHDAQPDTG